MCKFAQNFRLVSKMKHIMSYKGHQIKIWDGRGGLGIKSKSYLAETIAPPIITLRRDSISRLRNDIKVEIDRKLTGETR